MSETVHSEGYPGGAVPSRAKKGGSKVLEAALRRDAIAIDKMKREAGLGPAVVPLQAATEEEVTQAPQSRPVDGGYASPASLREAAAKGIGIVPGAVE